MSFRRLLSTSAVRLATDVPALSATHAEATSVSHNFIPASRLPQVLFRRIAKHIRAIRRTGEKSESTSLPNPFVLHRGRDLGISELTDREMFIWRGPDISPRRQKQLLQLYSPADLPPSALNPIEARPVRWTDGTIVTWEGEAKEKFQKHGPYSGRPIMFKGHKDERTRAQRMAERQLRMDGMEQRVAKWRKNKADERIQNKSALPF